MHQLIAKEYTVRIRVFFVAIVVSCAVALVTSIGSQKAFSQNPTPPGVKALPAGFTIPPQDVHCILPGNRVDLQCLIKNDPDFIRVRAEEAGLEAQALAAAESGTLDPFHQVETPGNFDFLNPNLSVNKNLACSYCHDPSAGYRNGVSILSVFTGGSNPVSVPITF